MMIDRVSIRASLQRNFIVWLGENYYIFTTPLTARIFAYLPETVWKPCGERAKAMIRFVLMISGAWCFAGKMATPTMFPLRIIIKGGDRYA